MRKLVNKKELVSAALFILPALIPLLLFWVGPVIYSFVLSLTDWDMMSENINFVFLDNYKGLLNDRGFYGALKNTLVFALGSMIPTIVFGLLIALALNGTRKGMGIYRAIMFVPYITPMVAVSIVWSWIFEPRVGVFNFLLNLFGLPGLAWTKSSDTAMLSVIIVTVWKQIGWTMLFYMEALRKVPQNLIEAAAIDGAGAAKRFWNIVLPMISPTTFFLVVITTIQSLQAYDQINVLTQGGPAGATRTLVYYYYFEAFDRFKTGRASAVGVVLVIITVILSLMETAASKKMVHY